MMPNTKHDALRSRRERGRRSQATYRKRQAQASRELTEQNSRLINSVKEVVGAIRGDEAPELLDRILEAADAAGVDAKNLTRSIPAESGFRPSNEDSHACGDGVYDEDVYNGSTKHLVQKSGRQPYLSSQFPVIPSVTLQQLTYSIWLDPLCFTPNYNPPEDIKPYLGAGSETFAGRLFWSVMEHARSGCEHVRSDPIPFIQKALYHSEATAYFKPSFVVSMARARLEYHRTGSISPENATAGESDLGIIVRDRIEAEYQSNGKDSRLWLTCLAIEKRVRCAISSYATAFGLLDVLTGDQGETALQGFFSSVKCTFFHTGVCFGDGPRWNVSVVDALIFDWLSKSKASAATANG